MKDETFAATVNKRGCPECGAPIGQLCWSRLHGRPMENQVHAQRWGLVWPRT